MDETVRRPDLPLSQKCRNYKAVWDEFQKYKKRADLLKDLFGTTEEEQEESALLMAINSVYLLGLEDGLKGGYHGDAE